MNERRGLKRMVLRFSPEVARSQPTQFLVNDRSEITEGLPVALGPLSQQSRHIVSIGHG